MRARWGSSATLRFGWLWPAIAALAAVASTADATDATDSPQILYYERLPALAAQASAQHKARSAQQRKSTAAAARTLSFDAYGRRFDLSLEENTRLSDQFQIESGRSSLQLYRGVIEGNPRSWVRFSFDQDQVQGMIWDGSDLFVIEPERAVLDSPAAYADQARSGDGDAAEPVIFRLADVLMDPGAASCAADTLPAFGHDHESAEDLPEGAGEHLGEQADRTTNGGDKAFGSLMEELQRSPAIMQAAGASRRLTLSVLGDAQFLQRHPGGRQAARDAIMQRMNYVDGIFSAQLGIQIHVDALLVHDSASDPLSDTTSPQSLLDELGLVRRNSRELRSRGLTHLFTGRDLDGTTIGIAYSDPSVNSLCSTRYGASLTQAYSLWRDSLVAAHEIGHNFGAPHDDEKACQGRSPASGFLMAANIGDAQNVFSDCSLEQMRPRIQAAACITDLPPADMAVAKDLGTLHHPLSTPFDWALEVTNIGGVSARNVRVDLGLTRVMAITEPAYVEGGSCTSGAGMIQCQLGDVPGGASRTIHLRLRSDVAGSNSIFAQLVSDNDFMRSNDRGEGTLVIGLQADLAVSLTGPAEAAPAESFDIEFSASNHSAIDASDIIVAIDLPQGMTSARAAIENGYCSTRNQRLECSLARLPAGARAAGSATLQTALGGSATVSAQVSGGYFDPVANNDRALLVVEVAAAQSDAQTGSGSGGGGSPAMALLLSLLGLLGWCTRQQRHGLPG